MLREAGRQDMIRTRGRAMTSLVADREDRIEMRV